MCHGIHPADNSSAVIGLRMSYSGRTFDRTKTGSWICARFIRPDESSFSCSNDNSPLFMKMKFHEAETGLRLSYSEPTFDGSKTRSWICAKSTHQDKTSS